MGRNSEREVRSATREGLHLSFSLYWSHWVRWSPTHLRKLPNTETCHPLVRWKPLLLLQAPTHPMVTSPLISSNPSHSDPLRSISECTLSSCIDRKRNLIQENQALVHTVPMVYKYENIYHTYYPASSRRSTNSTMSPFGFRREWTRWAEL